MRTVRTGPDQPLSCHVFRRPVVDFAFRAILLLNLTNIFVFAAPLSGLGVADVSVALLGCTVLYMAYRWPTMLRCSAAWDVRAWIVLLLLWPLATLPYAVGADARAVVLQVYNVTLLVASAVYVRANGWAAFRSTIGVALGVTAFGLALSMTNPELFTTIGELIKAPTNHGGRAFGFFVQPNVAAESTVFMFLIWFAAGRQQRSWELIAGVLALFVMVGVTGSRAAAGAALVTSFNLAADAIRRRVRAGGRRYTAGFVTTVAILLPTVAVGGIALGIVTFGAGRAVSTDGILGRFLPLLQGQLRSTIDGDVSLLERLFSLQQHLALFAQRPLAGYGLAATSYFLAAEQVVLASHNMFVDLAVNFGLPFVVALAAVLIRLARHPARETVERQLGTNLYFLLAVAFAMLAMSSNTVFYSRTFLVVLGGALGPLTRSIVVHRRGRVAGVDGGAQPLVGFPPSA